VRWHLAAAYLPGTWMPLAVAGVVERRRLALAAGLRGRGTIGYIRGWIKTSAIDLVMNDADAARSTVLRDSVRDFESFSRLMPAALLATAIVVVVLIF